ncbi:hypothetical protein BTS2_0416 [Bacillus sp. TS-2]|nr:hypothetical protein BTS2_0416 [Bacillus sp. TS-2]
MKFFKKILENLLEARNKKQWNLLTVDHLTKQMELEAFDVLVIKEFTNIFEKRIEKFGEKHFKWSLKQLHYQNIAEFEHVEFASDFYY